jgi:excisionase family DNA binding protein
MQNREARHRAASIERRGADEDEASRSGPQLTGWHTVDEWAESRGCTPRTIRNLIARGLRSAKMGATRLVHEDDFAAFLEANARGGNLSKR